MSAFCESAGFELPEWSTVVGVRTVARKAAAPLMVCEAAAGLQDLDLWKGVLIALLLRTVSHDHQLKGNDRQKRITYEDQRKLNHDGTPFVMRSLHCKLSTVSISGLNLLIVRMLQVIGAGRVPVEAEIQGRELCNDNNLR